MKRRSGTSASNDLEPLLAALGAALPAGPSPAQLHFANQTLRVQGLALEPQHISAVQAALQARGLSLRQEGNDVWMLQAEGVR